MKSRRITALAALILPLLGVQCGQAASSDTISWDFSDSGQLSGWKGEGIEASRVEGGMLQLRGGERIQLAFPPGLHIPAEKNPYLRIRLRILSPRIAQVFWFPEAPGREIPVLPVQLDFDRRFHTYWVDLADSLDWIGTIDRMGLAFGGKPGWIEIDSIDLGPFSLSTYLADQWHEFWLPRLLHPGTINSLNGPRFFNKPFVSWLNRLAVLVFLIGAVLYYKTGKNKRARIVARTGLVILALWVIYDVRETYSQFKIEEEIQRVYAKPPLDLKTFPALGDFYRLVEFCRKKIPEESVFRLLPEPYWPFDCRIKYYLYPRHIETDKTRSFYGVTLPRYYIVYNAPGLTYDSTRGQIVDGTGQAYTGKGKIIARYNKDSFIFLEEQPWSSIRSK